LHQLLLVERFSPPWRYVRRLLEERREKGVAPPG
jgi:hypothetical protein